MSRYDGLIIPRSYSEYINKTDAATLLQALQLSGVMDNAPIANSNKPVKSGGIYSEFNKIGKQTLLYNGETYDGTEKSLNQSLKNFRYLYIGLKTNTETDYIMIPTENINNGNVFCRTMMQNNTFGQVTLPFAYQSSIRITIVNETKFYAQSQYNNLNWILKVYAIWGLN